MNLKKIHIDNKTDEHQFVKNDNKANFTKDYVDFLNDEGWGLEKKFPSNRNYYSDLLEDTEWDCKQ